MMLPIIRVILGDDHVLLQTTLKHWIEAAEGIRVDGVASSGDEALDLILRIKPDVAVLDINMPGRTCFEVASAIRGICLGTRVIILSALTGDVNIRRALDTGISGYVSKSEPPNALLEAIRTVASGTRYFSNTIRDRLDESCTHLKHGELASVLAVLTLREKEVLTHLGRGLSLKEAASALSLSPKTIDNHAQRMMNKLNIHTRADLVRFAVREGLVEP